MNKHYLSILDVGCRYGVFPIFKKNIKILNYSGVDCDNSEIKRLKNKYSNEKNVKLHCAFLSNESKNIDLFIPDHRGYISSKKINKKSIWFNKLRKQESKINKIKNIKSQNSSEFIERNKIKTDIIKLDIEGGELDLVKDLVRCLDPKRADLYKDWLDVGMVLHNINEDLFDTWKDRLRGFILEAMF